MKWFDRNLIEAARKLPAAKVAVIGDLVCDLTVFGQTKRISREAPVLILEYLRESISLGGAANTVNNLRALGGSPMPIGVFGDDDSGKKMRRAMSDLGIDTGFIFDHPNRLTTVKTRMMGSGLHTTFQQMLRIDQGHKEEIDSTIEDRVIAALDQAVSQCNVLVVSDYGYGLITQRVLNRINELATAGTIPVYVDSRYRLSSFAHPGLLTPNEPEAEEAVGLTIRSDEDTVEAARQILDKTSADAVCITRGKRGMHILTADNRKLDVPIFGTDEISDVTGAGDTVMAVFAAARSVGIDLFTAARLATVAGGLVVMKSGTATITSDEIIEALEDYVDDGQ